MEVAILGCIMQGCAALAGAFVRVSVRLQPEQRPCASSCPVGRVNAAWGRSKSV